jgi:GT2 family glycosyltransferase
MMISVIIVNYNVKYFLEQCLYSVRAALKNCTGEIIVVDNASTDNSVAYLQSKFPSVKFTANSKNTGFGGGCNKGFKASSGEFVLFLNPDSIIPEDCFEKCLPFINNRPEAGAIGVKMLDGSGNFLSESKRGFPSLPASLFKLTGLAQLFPHSKLFARYYLGHLDENKDHEIDVLAGAFILMKKNVFEKLNGFDEAFFMYGEDIDLSYRVQKAGFKNYYFADTEILHFKGESTKKGNLNYVKMFYNAMSTFVNKHYKGSIAGLYKFFIHAGIWLVAFFSVIKKFIAGLFHVSNKNSPPVTAIVGTEEEYQKLTLLLKRIQPGDQIRKRISINELAAMTKPYPFNELIICAGTITYKETIQLIKQLPGDLSIKIHAAGSNSIIGSSSKDKPGNAIGLDDL